MVVSLQHLATITGGVILQGEPESTYSGISSLDLAQSHEISFLGNSKYNHQFLQTKAGVVIVDAKHPPAPDTVAIIVVENSTLSFSKVIELFTEKADAFCPLIHPSAIIDPSADLDYDSVRIHAGVVIMAGAVIGKNTEIFPNCVIGAHVHIGKNCLIHANVSIREKCVLGDRVIIQPGAVIGADGYGYQFSQGRHVKIPQVGIVEIENDVEIGANTCIDRARFGKTLIGEGTKIDNLVQIGHNVQIGKHSIIIALTGVAGSSKIGNYVTVAAQVGIAGHLSVGDKAVLAARVGVTQDLEGGIAYLGNPAQPMRKELKQQALIRRLPELFAQIKKLKQGDEQNPS